MRRAVLPLLVFLFLWGKGLFGQGGAKTPPRPEDFAGTMPVSGTPGSLMVLEIPEQVYRGLERSDQGDLRVFDGSGAPVPFGIRKPPRQIRTPPPEQAPFFIWKPGTDLSLPNPRSIAIDPEGGVITITGPQGLPPAFPTYLVDLSGLSRSPSTLKIIIEPGERFFNSAVTLHSSGDLNRWSVFPQKQTIAYYGNSGADRTHLEIPEGAGYLLLSFEGDIPGIRAIEAVFPPEEVSGILRETPVLGEKSPDGTFIRYDTGGYYPVVSIDFRFQEPDAVQVSIKNRLSLDEPWGFQAQERIFRFHAGASGEVRTNQAFNIASAAPYWELEALGDAPFREIPVCYIAWEPYQLVFLARGTGPWTLAYGNAGYEPPKGGGLRVSPEEILLPAAVLGEGHYEARRVEKKREVNWSQWILWGVLILGVILLSALAWRIAKTMKGDTHRA